MTEPTVDFSYRFGRFELQPSERRLLVAGEPAAVGPRAFDVLVALVERAGRLVTKDELLERVWPKLVVEENNLQTQVSALRKILGPAAIATVSGRGYRFTLELRREVVVPSPSAEAAKHNLPQQVTSFIGRERELAEVKELLAKTRLLTLVGAGGIGKTRLALQVAAATLDEYADGVWLLEFGSIADPLLVPTSVAQVLGVREQAGTRLTHTLCAYLKSRRLLLVLDNCEHLIQACAELADALLKTTQGISILATSREPLQVGGEQKFPLPSLSLPEPSASAQSIARSDAVQLFVERARLQRPGFVLTERQAPAVAELCGRLDGIPLALELAAARAHSLSIEEINARLDDRFRLLTGGTRTALPRQQTLRATLDWSYGLLGEQERAVLRRLAVFAGGCTLQAAEVVAAGGDVHERDILELLTRLVEKSLVEFEAERERYRLLETVRQYAEEQLIDRGEQDQARMRHLTFYFHLTAEAQLKLLGAEQGTWFSRLDLEQENLLSAHAWCDRAPGGAEMGLMLVSEVQRYWTDRGLLTLGHQMTLEALARAGTHERTPARCRALFGAGEFGCFMGRYEEAKGHLKESLAIAWEIGDKERVAMVLPLLAMACLGEGDLAAARRHSQEALALAREHGNKRDLAAALNALAQLHRVEGKLDMAEPLYDESLALCRERGDGSNVAAVLLNIAVVSIGRGLGNRARRMLLEALMIVDEIGLKRLGPAVLDVSAGLAAFLGEWERAAWLHRAANTQGEPMVYHRDPADEALLAPLIARARDALGTATLAAAERAGRALSYEAAMAEARKWLEEPS